ncbi:MAG: hypothetical protein GEU80_17000 [Dehalococcoidia bacterium]|nr:hypothetical protein [Dehalococcoidia bacterium]
MDQIVICGWDQRVPAILEALEAHARLRAVAVGDRQPAPLVRARAATGLACYQHVLEMLRSVPAGAMLLNMDGGAGEYARVAAAHGADLLVVGDVLDGSSLRAAATAARRHGVALAVLRPALRSAGASFLTGLAATDRTWRPRFAEIEVVDDTPAPHQVRTAVALAARLMPDAPVNVLGSALGGDPDTSEVIAVQLRYASGDLLTVTARTGHAPTLAVRGESHAGRFEVTSTAGASTVALTRRGAGREETELRDDDPWATEARRVIGVRRGDGTDARHAPAEAAMLLAMDVALETGDVARVEAPGPRAAMRLLDGGAEERTPRRGSLRLVTG